MSITSISLDLATFNKLELGTSELPLTSALHLRPLKQTVVLAGQNGAGKSRLLRLIPKLMQKQLDPSALEEIESQLRQRKVYLEQSVKNAKTLKERADGTSEGDIKQQIIDQIKDTNRTTGVHASELKRLELQINATKIMCISDNKPHPVITLVPKIAKLVNPATKIDLEAGRLAERIANRGCDDAEMTAPAYMRRVMQAALTARDKRRNLGQETITTEENTEKDLKDILQKLLGTEIEICLEDTWRLLIGGYDLQEQKLSEGQQLLFQFGCILHAQGASLSDCIVLMDEPENHLHPAVLTQIVDKLRSLLTDGQLWIATHSVPLIAHLVADEPDCLWYAESGNFKRAGRSPERVLESLMGGSDGAKRLHDFTLRPAQYAALSFMAQCLQPPGVVGPEVKDPQTSQIAEILWRHSVVGEKKLRIMDFGAGKGRLLSTLASGQGLASQSFDYYAYDNDDTNQADCQIEIDTIFSGDGKNRYFTDIHTLAAHIDGQSVDVVVMCNVLHEIDPDQWISLFGPSGVLCKLLAPTGHILFVEDYGITVGEQAHRFGFLLLDEPELCSLFWVKEADRADCRFIRETTVNDERYRNRLVAHLIGKDCIARITSQSQVNAIRGLHDRMAGELTSLLASDSSASSESGRAYARCSQLMANATLWLRTHQGV